MSARHADVCPAARTHRTRRQVTALTGLSLAVALLSSTSAARASEPVPATPSGFTSAIEAAQPYIGQSTCDPTAKPGVSAFRDLLLQTYRDTGSLGIVQDCGSGGQSEHKEGRAFDWAVSVNNSQQVQEVNALLTWLTQPDQYGHPYAMARRLGIMYMIWNHRMWRAYATSSHQANSWDPYVGVSAHTDHVHFSFGWNGAEQATSFWHHGAVAPVYGGPQGGAPAGGVPDPVLGVTPLIRLHNTAILASYGQTTLSQGSRGAATSTLQQGLGITADGDFGPQTSAAVSAFQSQQRLAVTGQWSPADWPVLFPVPAVPPRLAANVAVLRDFGQLTLSTGATGSAVNTVQRALAITTDGTYGPQTTAAVTMFQTQQELPVTGRWSPPEWQRMFPLPLVAPSTAVTINGTPEQSPAFNSQFTISGTGQANSAVTLHSHPAGADTGVYPIVRTVQANALGQWARPILANVDYRYYATSSTGQSQTVLNTPSPTIDGPQARVLPRGRGYLLTGHGEPGATVLLNFHNAGTAPGDYSVRRPVSTDATGTWTRRIVPTRDCRVFVSRTNGATNGGTPVLLQAR